MFFVQPKNMCMMEVPSVLGRRTDSAAYEADMAPSAGFRTGM